MIAPASPSSVVVETPRPDRPLSRAETPAPGSAPRFTLDGDPKLEEHLRRTCDRIAAGLRGLLPARKLEGVLLGGGYGRGEGGVCGTPDGDRPYNDLEFYVFLRGNRHVNERVHGHALHVFGEILTPQAGMDVEFRISSLPEFEAAGVSMFSYDLVSGHRWLIGDEALLAHCQHHRDAAAIPSAEATRLMMNRCTGLLLAQERLARAVFTAADADFVARNSAKAQLGAGDAVLTAQAQYHWSVRERHRRLEQRARGEKNAWYAALLGHHALGTEFKLHPTRSAAGRKALAQQHRAVTTFCRDVWLRLEGRRLGANFDSVCAYAETEKNKCPETSPLRNVLVNAKQLGARVALSPRAVRHPREAVLTALPLLLWEPGVLTSPVLLRRVQGLLRTNASDFRGLVSAYREIWSRVN